MAPNPDPAQAVRLQAYARVFGDAVDTQVVLDDLVAYAGGQTDPLVRAGITLAVHRCYAQRALARRVRKGT